LRALARRCRDRHVHDTLYDPIDWHLDRYFNGHVARHDPDLDARHPLVQQRLEPTEQYYQQRQEAEQPQSRDQPRPCLGQAPHTRKRRPSHSLHRGPILSPWADA